MDDDREPLAVVVPGLVTVSAVGPHGGPLADLVRELKYGRATAVVSELAERLAAIAPPAELITWAPASPARRRRRGFDQSELLARAVARRARTPVRRLLRRSDDTAQTARDIAGRRAGPSLLPAGRRLRGRPRVLVVDDVATTGATLAAAAEVVSSRGAGTVLGAVLTVAAGEPGTARHGPGIYALTTRFPTEVDRWTSPSVHGM